MSLPLRFPDGSTHPSLAAAARALGMSREGLRKKLLLNPSMGTTSPRGLPKPIRVALDAYRAAPAAQRANARETVERAILAFIPLASAGGTVGATCAGAAGEIDRIAPANEPAPVSSYETIVGRGASLDEATARAMATLGVVL